ncbi:MAG: prolipoprotein diacylglyceryl transferase [Sandaracinaceae bacterium]|nr:prolipoprotein diacylglyceryl transferase [Sandaracinaceae bacterium]
MLLSIPWWRPPPFEIPLPATSFLPPVLYVYPFGLLVALGVLVGVFAADRRARQVGLHPRICTELAGHVLIGAFVMAHVLDALFYHFDQVLLRPWLVLELWNGMSSFGGFVGAAAGALVWKWRRGDSLVAFLDPIAWGFPMGWIFGRLGCFVTHDHPGRVTDFPLAVADYEIQDMLPPWQTRHDLGLYEAIGAAAISLLFVGLAFTKRKRGFYLALLPILYAPLRFGLDFLRATDVPMHDPRWLGLTPGHYAAIVLLLAGGVMAWWVRSRPEVTVGKHARWPVEGPPARPYDSGDDAPRGDDARQAGPF